MSNALSRRFVLGLSCAFVAAAVAGPVPAGAAEPGIIQPVERLYAGLLGIMKQGASVPFPQRFAAIAPVIEASMDVPGILRQSVGSAWAGLSAEDQAALLAAFRRYIVASYVANFDAWSGQTFEVLPETRQAGGTQVVQSRIIRTNGAPRVLDYAMRQVDGTWRIADVLADGSISNVAVQRSDFRGLIASGGAAALIASLRKKVADLSGGTLQ